MSKNRNELNYSFKYGAQFTNQLNHDGSLDEINFSQDFEDKLKDMMVEKAKESYELIKLT